jgi:hypothetical protein
MPTLELIAAERSRFSQTGLSLDRPRSLQIERPALAADTQGQTTRRQQQGLL